MDTRAARGTVTVSMLILGALAIAASGTIREIHSWVNSRVSG